MPTVKLKDGLAAENSILRGENMLVFCYKALELGNDTNIKKLFKVENQGPRTRIIEFEGSIMKRQL